jgi:hypothetical protein
MLVSIVLLTVGTSAAPAPISLSSDFKFGFAPATFKVRIQVEPNPDNRIVCFEYDGGSYSRSCWEAEGEKFPRTKWIELKRLPAGAYVAAALVMRADGSSRVARIEWEVLESLPQ